MSKRGKDEAIKPSTPFFAIIQEGLTGLVDGEHFFEHVRRRCSVRVPLDFPGWPRTIRGRAGLVDQFSGYGATSSFTRRAGSSFIARRTGASSSSSTRCMARIVRRTRPTTIVHLRRHGREQKDRPPWRDYMDSLAHGRR